VPVGTLAYHFGVNSRGLAGASLLLNVVLLAVVAYLLSRPVTSSGPSAVLHSQASQGPVPETTSAEQPDSLNGLGQHTPDVRPLWRQIESADYTTYIANLRAVGCPEQTIREIVQADVNKLYNDRKAALYTAAAGPFTYWATDTHLRVSLAPSAELADQLAQYDRERHALLGQLFGTDPGDNNFVLTEQELERQRRLSFLPQAKQNQLRALEGSYPGIEKQIQVLVDTTAAQADAQELQQLLERYTRKKAELSQLLSPDEYEQYELSTSWTADNLRRRLAGFQPTEEEFRGIFRLWRAQDERLATVYALRQPEPGNQEVFEAIRQFLGEERNAQYRQAWGGHPVPPAAESSRTAIKFPAVHP
jgi:hypothetical protein